MNADAVKMKLRKLLKPVIFWSPTEKAQTQANLTQTEKVTGCERQGSNQESGELQNMNKTEKAKATRDAKAAEFAAQTIEIDADWRIVRADELNWEVQYKGKFDGYYGNLISAMKALPLKMLNSGAKNSVADVIERQKAIEQRIETALNLKLAA